VRPRIPVIERLRVLAPGLAAAIAVAVVARGVAVFLPPALSEVLVAVLFGIVVANSGFLPASAIPGLRFAVQRVLRLGIILLGARLSLGDVAQIGTGALLLVVVTMTVAFSVALLAGRVVGVPRRLALLIGVGTAVCGNSAIVATAPVIEAEEREVSFAVATITLFGTLAVFLYPLVGHALNLSSQVFGTWTGVAVNDTSQVVAASAAFSPEARDVATVVKLVRNTLMAPLIVLIAWWWGRQQRVEEGKVRAGALRAFPLFVLGFLFMALLRTIGVIDRPLAAPIDEVARACILVALAGVGLSTRLVQLRSMGPKAFYVGFGTAVTVAVMSLAALQGFSR
jgi:uncharacterized integral membrane protein (TIGR00698 family)